MRVAEVGARASRVSSFARVPRVTVSRARAACAIPACTCIRVSVRRAGAVACEASFGPVCGTDALACRDPRALHALREVEGGCNQKGE